VSLIVPARGKHGPVHHCPLTDPSSVPHELATVVPGTVVPVQTIVLENLGMTARVRPVPGSYDAIPLVPGDRDSEKLLENLATIIVAQYPAVIFSTKGRNSLANGMSSPGERSSSPAASIRTA
jgi:hypothetical protein